MFCKYHGTCDCRHQSDTWLMDSNRFILNDSYRTDAPLLYPPYIIALSAIYIAFCLTSMSNSSARTRASSTQRPELLQSASINDGLNLLPPPKNAAEFLAGFQVSLPMLFSCVQEIIGLYPVWEAFEPTVMRNSQAQAKTGNAVAAAAGTKSGQNDSAQDKKDKFGLEEAESLVRKMIEERMIDLGHPDNAGVEKAAGTGPSNVAGKKRARIA